MGLDVCHEIQRSSSEHIAGLPQEKGASASTTPDLHMCQGSGWVQWIQLFLVCVSDSSGTCLGNPDSEQPTAQTRCIQDTQWVWDTQDLCLEVLVDLGHILHHALPVRPVRVQQLTELLWERAEVSECHWTFPPGRQVQATPSQC